MQNDQAGSGLRGAESGERGPHRGEGERQDQVSTVPFRGLLQCQKFGLWYLLAVRRSHGDRLPEGVFLSPLRNVLTGTGLCRSGWPWPSGGGSAGQPFLKTSAWKTDGWWAVGSGVSLELPLPCPPPSFLS